MQKIIFSLMACLLVSRAGAQLFSPESWNGTVLGGIVGGIIGHNHHGQTGEGIAIGAGAGWLLGTLAHENRRDQGWYSQDYVYGGPPVGVRFYTRPGVSACYGYAPVYGYSHPDYAWNGAVLGGITGGIIGHNSHGRTAESAAIGAGAGLVLGSLADAQANRRHSQTPAITPKPAKLAPTARITSRAVTVPSPGGKPLQQIPDAPRVPDAPTF